MISTVSEHLGGISTFIGEGVHFLTDNVVADTNPIGSEI